MIGSFKDGQNGELATFYVHGTRSAKIPAIIEKPLRRKLSLLAAASSENHCSRRPVTIMNACRVISLDGQALG